MEERKLRCSRYIEMDGMRKGAHESGGRSFSECVESRGSWKESLLDGRSVDGDGSRDGDRLSLNGGRDDELSGFGGHGGGAISRREGGTEGEGHQRRRRRRQKLTSDASKPKKYTR